MQEQNSARFSVRFSIKPGFDGICPQDTFFGVLLVFARARPEA